MIYYLLHPIYYILYNIFDDQHLTWALATYALSERDI